MTWALPDFFIKQNDTQAAIKATLSDAAGVFDLTGSTVALHLRPRFGASSTTLAATITDPTNGVVQYQWQPGDTATAGDFLIEWQVTLPTGDIATFPNTGFQLLRITRELA